jgi:hypothetical protein
MKQHVDDKGRPCERHATLATTRLYELAVVGTRIPGFHHDCASKLQSLMMALDEIGELADHDDAELRVAANTANTALRELHDLLTDNRALARPPQPKRIGLGDLLGAAARRAGVRVHGELAAEVEVVIPAMTHALALVLDLLAEPIQRGRTVDASVELGDLATITLSGPAGASAVAPTKASEAIAIASFVIERDGGQLCCKRSSNAVVVRLPLKPSLHAR